MLVVRWFGKWVWQGRSGFDLVVDKERLLGTRFSRYARSVALSIMAIRNSINDSLESSRQKGSSTSKLKLRVVVKFEDGNSAPFGDILN
jgi:hypothetical protein